MANDEARWASRHNVPYANFGELCAPAVRPLRDVAAPLWGHAAPAAGDRAARPLAYVGPRRPPAPEREHRLLDAMARELAQVKLGRMPTTPPQGSPWSSLVTTAARTGRESFRFTPVAWGYDVRQVLAPIASPDPP
jgi:hypothetical protein